MSFSKETEVSQMNQLRLKKPASRTEKKPKEATASDNCRLCGSCFKTQFENFKTGWITTEPIFSPSRRKRKDVQGCI